MVKQITDPVQLDLCDKGVEFAKNDPNLAAMMDEGNAVTLAENFVDHGREHANDVVALAMQIIEQTELLSSEPISRYMKATAELGAYLHDIGRIKGSKNHDKTGAVLARNYLDTIRIDGKPLPRAFINRIVFIVRNHRAESWLHRKRKRQFDGPDVVAVIIADKLCGSEARVPEQQLNAMKVLANIPIRPEFRAMHQLDANWTLARIPWNDTALMADEPQELLRAAQELLTRQGIAVLPSVVIDHHDKVNGSIYGREIRIYEELGVNYLTYSIEVDERLAPRELVTGLDWWNDALHLATIAAAYLNLKFSLEFNGRRLHYSREAHDWLPVAVIAA